jgi:hypothetical protein
VKGTGHYRVHVDAWRARSLFVARRRERRGKLTVTVSDRVAPTYATYTTAANFNRHRIRADLGAFGSIAVRLNGAQSARASANGQGKRRAGLCEQSETGVFGDFHGTLRFRGEDNYVRVRAHRLHGFVGRSGPARCHGHDHGIGLVARASQTKFTAFEDTDLGVTVLGASTKARVGHVTVHRRAYRYSRADAGEFSFDPGLTSAHIAPAGDPFSGSADFASPASWTGPLAVSFLGEDNVPLAGPEYRVTLKKVTVGKHIRRRQMLPVRDVGP